MRLWNESGGTPIVARSRIELIRFFDQLELLEPGVISCSRCALLFAVATRNQSTRQVRRGIRVRRRRAQAVSQPIKSSNSPPFAP